MKFGDQAAVTVADQAQFYDEIMDKVLEDFYLWTNLKTIYHKYANHRRGVDPNRNSSPSDAHSNDPNMAKIEHLMNFISGSDTNPWEKILHCYYIIVIVCDLDIDSDYSVKTNVDKLLAKHCNLHLYSGTCLYYEKKSRCLYFIKNVTHTRNIFRVTIGFYNYTRDLELRIFQAIKNDLISHSQSSKYKIFDNEIYGYLVSHNSLAKRTESHVNDEISLDGASNINSSHSRVNYNGRNFSGYKFVNILKAFDISENVRAGNKFPPLTKDLAPLKMFKLAIQNFVIELL
jgi:hypothetical protein